MRLALIVMMLFIVGCASLPYEKTIALKHAHKEYYNFDLSNSFDIGKLIIQARPPSTQAAVKNYAIVIDNYDPLIVFKHSDSDIFIDVGKHTLKLYVPSGGIFGEMFGKPTIREIDVKKDGFVILEYTGPYWAFSEGKIKEQLTY